MGPRPKVMQRVPIFHFGQPTDHKGARILCAEKFDFAQPLQKLLTLLIRWLLFRPIGRHFVGLHNRQCLVPALAGGTFVRLFECRCKVDSAPLSILPVTSRAVGIDEWSNYLFKVLPGIDL